MKELLELPGVARKTANIVLSNAYDVIEGIVVDTHVRRVSKRLGLTENDKADKVEKDLMEIVTLFASRIYGKHGHKYKKVVEAVEQAIKDH